jgi:hypothetical protein
MTPIRNLHTRGRYKPKAFPVSSTSAILGFCIGSITLGYYCVVASSAVGMMAVWTFFEVRKGPRTLLTNRGDDTRSEASLINPAATTSDYNHPRPSYLIPSFPPQSSEHVLDSARPNPVSQRLCRLIRPAGTKMAVLVFAQVALEHLRRRATDTAS